MILGVFVVAVMALFLLPAVNGEDLANFEAYSECNNNVWTAYITDSEDNLLSGITATTNGTVIPVDSQGVVTIPSHLNIGKVTVEIPGYVTQILNTQCLVSEIPQWVKAIIVLWSTDQISDGEFKAVLAYLVDSGIIKTETKLQYYQILSENAQLQDQISNLEEENQCLKQMNTTKDQTGNNAQCDGSNQPQLPTPPSDDEPISVIFVNLEKAGESILVIAPDGSTMLIDGGLKGSHENLASVLREHDIDTINVMVSTHADQDHVAGLTTILESNAFDVEQVWVSPVEGTTKTYQNFVKAASDNGITLQTALAGQAITLYPSMNMSVLSPPSGGVPGAQTDKNENSVIIHLEYGDVSFLFTGDAEEKAEAFLTRNPIDINIMNGPHHGSKGSNTLEFITAFDPEMVVFSADDDNKHGHPHNEAISRYKAYDSSIKLYQTGKDGTITVETDGTNCTLILENSSQPCYPGISMLP